MIGQNVFEKIHPCQFFSSKFVTFIQAQTFSQKVNKKYLEKGDCTHLFRRKVIRRKKHIYFVIPKAVHFSICVSVLYSP